MTLVMVDYIMCVVLINLCGIVFIIIMLMTTSSKIKKQQRLIEFIYTRAIKAKKSEELREKMEEERVAKLRKSITKAKK